MLEGHTNSVRAVAVTPDGRRVVSGAYDETLRLRSKCGLKFCLGHLEEGLRGGSSHENPTASTKAKAVSLGILACMERRQIKAPRVCRTTLLSAQSPVWVWLTELLTRKGSGPIIRKRKERSCA
jgi:hypothetical protein